MSSNIEVVSVIGAIFSEDRSQILLIERRDVPVWTLPGGGVESGEPSDAAIIREILEETGFTVKVERLVGLYHPINRLSKVTHLYECSIVDGCAAISSETKNVRFFPLDKLPKKIPPPFNNWIKDAHKKQPFIEKKLREVNYRTFFFLLISHPILVFRFLLSRCGLSINS